MRRGCQHSNISFFQTSPEGSSSSSSSGRSSRPSGSPSISSRSSSSASSGRSSSLPKRPGSSKLPSNPKPSISYKPATDFTIPPPIRVPSSGTYAWQGSRPAPPSAPFYPGRGISHPQAPGYPPHIPSAPTMSAGKIVLGQFGSAQMPGRAPYSPGFRRVLPSAPPAEPSYPVGVPPVPDYISRYLSSKHPGLIQPGRHPSQFPGQGQRGYPSIPYPGAGHGQLGYPGGRYPTPGAGQPESFRGTSRQSLNPIALGHMHTRRPSPPSAPTPRPAPYPTMPPTRLVTPGAPYTGYGSRPVPSSSPYPGHGSRLVHATSSYQELPSHPGREVPQPQAPGHRRRMPSEPSMQPGKEPPGSLNPGVQPGGVLRLPQFQPVIPSAPPVDPAYPHGRQLGYTNGQYQGSSQPDHSMDHYPGRGRNVSAASQHIGARHGQPVNTGQYDDYRHAQRGYPQLKTRLTYGKSPFNDLNS